MFYSLRFLLVGMLYLLKRISERDVEGFSGQG